MNDERQEAQIMMKIVENLMAPGGKAIQITFQALDGKVGRIQMGSGIARKIAAKLKTMATEADSK
jgi:16S rRNA C1402 N4-methylase RsmH